MDELSPLFQDIEFRERLRGYDVEEVDAYIERVARAAALVHGRITELQQRADAAEARLVRPGPTAEASASAIADPTDPEYSMSRMLAIAQRTADTAIAEAEAEAALRRAEAEDHASRLLAEAETDRRRLIAEAERDAAAIATEQQVRLAAEIGELEEYKAFLSEDIEILETHLIEARLSLAASLSSLTDLLEQPEAFRVPAMAAVSGALPPAEFGVEDSGEEETAPRLDRSAVDSEDAIGASPGDGDGPDSPITDEADGLALAEADEAEAFSPADVPETRPAPLFAPQIVPAMTDDLSPGVVEDDPSGNPLAPSVGEPQPATAPTAAIDLTPGSIDVGAPVAASEPPLLVTAADFGSAEREDRHPDAGTEAGPVTQPVPVVTDQPSVFDSESSTLTAEPFLEQLREAVADPEFDRFDEDAISAFFDADQEQGGRSWFSRRR